MIAKAVLGRKFRSITSRDNVKKDMEGKLKSKLNSSYIEEVIQTITHTFEDVSKKGIDKKDKIKDAMIERIAEKRVFKFTQSILEEMIEALTSRSIEIFVQSITREHRDFQDFLQRTLGDTATVMERAIGTEPMWGLYFKEGETQCLISPIIALQDHLWLPSATCEIEMDNGDKLAPMDISRMLMPVIEAAYEKKQDRGAVEITGPKGGKYPCGQIYTCKRRDQMKETEKKIELSNGYVLELFVVAKKEAKEEKAVA